MKRLIRWAVWLYPPAWRRRYQKEFEALLEDLPASPQVFWNTLTEGLCMQFFSLGKPAALFALLGAVLAGGASFGLKDEFLASAVMQLSTPSGPMADKLGSAVEEALSRQKIAEMIGREPMYWGKQKEQPLDEVIDKLRKKISVSFKPVAGQNYLAVAVKHEQINIGKAIALDVAVSIREKYGLNMGENRIYLQPGSPNEPVFPNRRNISLAGLAAGCLVGLAFGLIQQHHQTVL